MFNKNTETVGIDKVIEIATKELENHDVGSEEYVRVMDQLERLYKMKASVFTAPNRVSADTWVSNIGSLAGIALIINFERLHALGTKALGFVKRV